MVSEVIDSDMNFSVFFQVFVGKGGGGGGEEGKGSREFPSGWTRRKQGTGKGFVPRRIYRVQSARRFFYFS